MLLALLLAAAAAAPPPIIGGAPTAEHPAVASVELSDGVGVVPVCSGALIRPQWVLTAAHCVADLRELAGVLTPQVAFGTDLEDRASMTELVEVDATYAHPDWRAGQFEADLGLLHLVAPADIAPLPLADDRATTAWSGVELLAVGWGVQSDDGADDGLKRALRMQVTEEGPALLELQAAAPDNLCHGDSGGPLLDTRGTSPQIVAVAAFVDQHTDAVGCAGGFSGAVRARIAADWISARIDGGTSYGHGLPATPDGCGGADREPAAALIFMLPGLMGLRRLRRPGARG